MICMDKSVHKFGNMVKWFVCMDRLIMYKKLTTESTTVRVFRSTRELAGCALTNIHL
uniref:Uncharacterized protein n=1 Tax=Arion vulgaris TaxID=1028688 RepID=A0A0B7B9U4_9EUPU